MALTHALSRNQRMTMSEKSKERHGFRASIQTFTLNDTSVIEDMNKFLESDVDSPENKSKAKFFTHVARGTATAASTC